MYGSPVLLSGQLSNSQPFLLLSTTTNMSSATPSTKEPTPSTNMATVTPSTKEPTPSNNMATGTLRTKEPVPCSSTKTTVPEEVELPVVQRPIHFTPSYRAYESTQLKSISQFNPERAFIAAVLEALDNAISSFQELDQGKIEIKFIEGANEEVSLLVADNGSGVASLKNFLTLFTSTEV